MHGAVKVSNKEIVNCKTCLVELKDKKLHTPEECIIVLQNKVIAERKRVAEWKAAWYKQRDATGVAAWQFRDYTEEQIAAYKK